MEWSLIVQKLRMLEDCRRMSDSPIAKINKIHGKIQKMERFNNKVGTKLIEFYDDAAIKNQLEKRLIMELIEETKAFEAILEGSLEADLRKKKRKSDEKAGVSNMKKSKTDDENALNTLPTGTQVVVRPNQDFILANIIGFRADRQKYEVEDAEEDEDKPGTKKTYWTKLKDIIVIPKSVESRMEFPQGHTVLALYPGTTCFYRATVVLPPSKNTVYRVRFEDDGGEDRTVPIEFCLDFPKPENHEAQFRKNAVGIQMVSKNLHAQLFRESTNSIDSKVENLAKRLLQSADLWGKQEAPLADVVMPLPQLVANPLADDTVPKQTKRSKTQKVTCDSGHNDLDFHFKVLGHEQSDAYKQLTHAIANCAEPPRPTTWSTSPGWTRYDRLGNATRIEYPDCEAIVFDIESMWKKSPYACVATAMGIDAWYSWVAPELSALMDVTCLNERTRLAENFAFSSLIPLGLVPAESGLETEDSQSNKKEAPKNRVRVVVGHNIAYDRARVLEEYNLAPNDVAWMDTMSFHSAVGGLSSQQRASWMQYRRASKNLAAIAELPDSAMAGEEFSNMTVRDLQSIALSEVQNHKREWMDWGSMNSLQHVYNLYTDKDLDKGPRALLDTENVLDIVDNFQAILKYCASDVAATQNVLTCLYPLFLQKCPHPVSFAGIVEMGKGFLPTTEEWDAYIQNSEEACLREQNFVQQKFLDLAEKALRLHNRTTEEFLEFERKETEREAALSENASKPVADSDVINAEMEPAVKIDKSIEKKEVKAKPKRRKAFEEEMEISAPPALEKSDAVNSSRTFAWQDDPWLKRLDWTPASLRGRIFPGYPKWYRELWDSKAKCIKISSSKRVSPYLLKLTWRNFPVYYNSAFGWLYRVPRSDKKTVIKEPEVMIPNDPGAKGYDEAAVGEMVDFRFYRIPHKDGEEDNCGNPLSKGYIKAFDQGILGSSYLGANEILTRQSMCSYWISARNRIKGQLIVRPGPSTHPGTEIIPDYKNRPDGAKIILPQIAVMGTVTRRAVEATWMTAANAKQNRIGSELKTLIRAPAGFAFVGADVDAEELWICSLLGDAQLGIHGSTPIGFMTLQGSKDMKTDLHTVTGRIIGIDRDVAKIFNYSRFYGAGTKHSTQLLMQHRIGIDKEEAAQKIKELFAATKGTKMRSKAGGQYGEYWYGGTESFTFNALEDIATSDMPKTPVLGSEIPNSLLPKHVMTDFATSRVNWAVQSSGVDYLHLLLTSMNYLFRRLKIRGRFMLSIHDEVRYLVRKEDVDKAALALQISNLWTRALFASRLGIEDLPLNIAFFSAVDIDHCLRKEVHQKCVTPTNLEPIESGRSASIRDTLETLGASLTNETYGPELESVKQAAQQVARDLKLSNFQAKPAIQPDPTWIELQMCKSTAEIRQVMRPLLYQNDTPRVSKAPSRQSVEARELQHERLHDQEYDRIERQVAEAIASDLKEDAPNPPRKSRKKLPTGGLDREASASNGDDASSHEHASTSDNGQPVEMHEPQAEGISNDREFDRTESHVGGTPVSDSTTSDGLKSPRKSPKKLATQGIKRYESRKSSASNDDSDDASNARENVLSSDISRPFETQEPRAEGISNEFDRTESHVGGAPVSDTNIKGSKPPSKSPSKSPKTSATQGMKRYKPKKLSAPNDGSDDASNANEIVSPSDISQPVETREPNYGKSNGQDLDGSESHVGITPISEGNGHKPPRKSTKKLATQGVRKYVSRQSSASNDGDVSSYENGSSDVSQPFETLEVQEEISNLREFGRTESNVGDGPVSDSKGDEPKSPRKSPKKLPSQGVKSSRKIPGLTDLSNDASSVGNALTSDKPTSVESKDELSDSSVAIDELFSLANETVRTSNSRESETGELQEKRLSYKGPARLLSND
ncbi:DNA-directed DNA polymerase gamma mip1 [Chytriomyces hyalinus]|nr:DNA-directed DNA polymerase gamma mip1 [Chytriomyces hyalinus]